MDKTGNDAAAAALPHSGPVAAHLHLGERLYRGGLFSRAAAVFRAAAEADPSCFWAHLGLGRTLSRQERWTEAEACLRRACGIQPGSIGAGLSWAASLRGLGRFRDAERVLRQVTVAAPWSHNAHLDLGRLYRDWEKLDKAWASLSRAVTLAPHTIDPYLERLPVAMWRGDFDRAFADGERILEIGVGTEVQLEKLSYPFGELGRPPWTPERMAAMDAALRIYLQTRPDSPWGHFYRIMFSILLDKDAEAFPHIAPLERLAAGRKGWMRWLAGVAYLRRWDWTPAAREFVAAAKGAPWFMRAHFLLGDALLGQGRVEEALRAFARPEPRDGDGVGMWLTTMGEIALRLGRYEEALGHLDKACGRGDAQALAWVWRGACRLRLQGAAAAFADLEEGVRRSPRDVEPYNWRGEARRLEGDLRGALEDLAQAQRVFPGDLAALINQALVHDALGDREAFRRDFQAVQHGLFSRWGALMPGRRPWSPADPLTDEQRRKVLEESLLLLGNWLRAHDLMPPMLLQHLFRQRPDRDRFEFYGLPDPA